MFERTTHKRRPLYRRPEAKCSCKRSLCGGGFYPRYYLRDVFDLKIKDGKRHRAHAGQLCEECRAFFDFKEDLRRRAEGTNPGLAVYVVSPFSKRFGSDPSSANEADERREVARYRDTGKIVVVYSDGSELEIPDPPPESEEA